MSAYVVDRNEISYLMAAMRRYWDYDEKKSLEYGQMIWDEKIGRASCRERV